MPSHRDPQSKIWPPSGLSLGARPLGWNPDQQSRAVWQADKGRAIGDSGICNGLPHESWGAGGGGRKLIPQNGAFFLFVGSVGVGTRDWPCA